MPLDPIACSYNRFIMNNVLLVDDHEIIRAGVKHSLHDLFKKEEIFEANDEASAILQLKARAYRLIITDVRMPDSQPFGLTDYIVRHYQGSRVLIFSMNEELIYAKKFLQAGAMGFVSKNAGLTELRKAIEQVLNGRKYLSANLTEHLAGMLDKTQPAANAFEDLSKRELEISTLLMEGKSLTEIADILAIAQSTVGTYKNRIFEKLGVKNLVELIEMGKANRI